MYKMPLSGFCSKQKVRQNGIKMKIKVFWPYYIMGLAAFAAAFFVIASVQAASQNSIEVPPKNTEPMAKGYTIPIVDLSEQTHRQVIVDKEEGQYLGHPTTVLLEDKKTIICVYPKGHGGGAIVMKRSTDGGLTWSERLSVPDNWAGSREVPTIHRVIDKEGVKLSLIHI